MKKSQIFHLQKINLLYKRSEHLHENLKPAADLKCSNTSVNGLKVSES